MPTIYEEYGQELAIFIAEKLQSAPGIQYRRCTNSLVQIRDRKQRIQCNNEIDGRGANSTVGIPGQFIHIRDERQIANFHFVLCEIEIYAAEGVNRRGIYSEM